jgi:hypothetical protein
VNDASGAVLEGYADGLGDAGAHFVVAAYRTNASLRFGAVAGILLLQAPDDANDPFGARGRRRARSRIFRICQVLTAMR